MPVPNLLCITDSYPCANGGGISQTLYNLLDNYKNQLYVFCRKNEDFSHGPVLDAKRITYGFEPRPHFTNRFLKSLNFRVTRANFNRQQQLTSLPGGMPDSKEAWVLVSTTEPLKLHFAWISQQRFGYTVIPYFMDDWLAGNKLTWENGNTQAVAKDLLANAPCWLMISRQLGDILRERYALSKKPTMFIHNPAPDTAVEILEEGSAYRALKLAYAGSIWGMHRDALVAMAKAISILRQEDGLSTFTIYTSQAAWDHNAKHFQGKGTSYGGFVPHAELTEKLQAFTHVVVAASFEEEYLPFTNSSIQTKLTDYMAAGKPLIYIGPSTGVSGQFVHEWDCGYSINTAMPEDIAAQLLAIRQMEQQSRKKARNGLNAAKGHFSKASVQARLYSFLEKYTRESVVLGAGERSNDSPELLRI